MTDGLVNAPVSGLLGLAFQVLASTEAIPFAQALLTQFDAPLMSFWLRRNLNPDNQTSLAFGGIFTLGGTNSTLFDGDIEYLNLVSSPSFWLLALSSKYSV